jgi:hypothetical protein
MIATGANRPLRGTVDLVDLIGGAVVPVVDRKRVSERYAPPGQERPGEAEVNRGGGRARGSCAASRLPVVAPPTA